MVGPIVERWQRDHWLHGDVVAGFVLVHDGDDELHGDWSDERHELHVHGDGHEQGRHWFCVERLGHCCSGDGSGCSDWCIGCLR